MRMTVNRFCSLMRGSERSCSWWVARRGCSGTCMQFCRLCNALVPVSPYNGSNNLKTRRLRNARRSVSLCLASSPAEDFFPRSTSEHRCCWLTSRNARRSVTASSSEGRWGGSSSATAMLLGPASRQTIWLRSRKESPLTICLTKSTTSASFQHPSPSLTASSRVFSWYSNRACNLNRLEHMPRSFWSQKCLRAMKLRLVSPRRASISCVTCCGLNCKTLSRNANCYLLSLCSTTVISAEQKSEMKRRTNRQSSSRRKAQLRESVDPIIYIYRLGRKYIIIHYNLPTANILIFTVLDMDLLQETSQFAKNITDISYLQIFASLSPVPLHCPQLQSGHLIGAMRMFVDCNLNLELMSAGEGKVQAKVKATDMDPDEIEKIKELLAAGLRESLKDHKQERVLSRYLKTEMDKNGSGWNCVVGKNFGAHVIHQTKKYIFLEFRELSILLWKA